MAANETASLMSWILAVLNKKEGVHILNEHVCVRVCACLRARVTPVASSRNSLAKPWKLLSQVTVFWIITIITGPWSMGELISFAHHIDMFNHTVLSFIITLKTADLLQQRAKALWPKLLLPSNATWWVRLSQVFSESLLLFFPSEWRWWWYEIPAVVVGRKQQSHQEAQFERRERKIMKCSKLRAWKSCQCIQQKGLQSEYYTLSLKARTQPSKAGGLLSKQHLTQRGSLSLSVMHHFPNTPPFHVKPQRQCKI